MSALLLAAILPGLLLSDGPAILKSQRLPDGVRIFVPADKIARWSGTGLSVADAAALTSYASVPPPGAHLRSGAAATPPPWAAPAKKVLYDRLPENTGPLAAAEAFLSGVDAVLAPDEADLPAVLNMLEFLKRMREGYPPVDSRDFSGVLRLADVPGLIGHVTGGDSRLRVHLLNYGGRPVKNVRFRLQGSYAPGRLSAFGTGDTPAGYLRVNGGVEYTVPIVATYVVMDIPPGSAMILASRRSGRDFPLSADPDTPEWRSATPVVITTDYNGHPVAGHRTEVRSRWSPGYLHVLFVNQFDELNLKADPDTGSETQRLWNWDVSEIFLGTDHDRITRYKEFQVSPQGEWLDLDIDRADPKGQAGASWNSGVQVRARIDHASKTWYGEFRIPFRDLGVSPAPGTELRTGLFRMAGSAPDRRYLSWQVTDGKTFHLPENFGEIRLADE